MTMSLTEGAVARKLSWLDKLSRRVVLNFIARLQHGFIRITEGSQLLEFGDKSADLHVTIRVQDPAFYRKMLSSGSIGAAEGYVEGAWSCDQLTDLVRIFARNLTVLDQMDSNWTRLSRPWLKLLNLRNSNSKRQARKNISAHYDLGNAMYRLFLDESMMYSSAVYPTADASLEQAQQHKLELLCQRLQLCADDHLLEIGTGWGGMAIYAAQHYGCKVTTTTISEQQYLYAKSQVEAAGLQDKITLLLQDYRDLTGSYDKLVSIEMIEAVGDEYLDTYFQACSSLLKPDGIMVLQAITMVDQRYRQYVREVDFIKRYIFPGGCLPSIHRMSEAVTKRTDLVIRQLQDIGLDYAKTLNHWCERFLQQKEEVQKLGYDRDFIRLWHYYLCYCEGGFLERATSTVHLVLSKPANRAAF
ncbi:MULTISPECIES: cyclopropane-fatty-acyl-phospholipid synthase family protein [Alkalimonas]|uniref:Cyclopropane-fatty-acyl-phospholipid synthase family protein n=1 Tax=Alkalimonas mucilaginosa TaxID=3057676 RepID=A0ABU7JHN9_9GAMM|nr:cyclopropane-fatty-acyl-phospholipid synthase family protein [Alkalimonas sp. MEB004]MEE2025194.1 cyclopropane-fatty-acyl-phospholipid synthase family protein [Alkalimonas sp. MEB004]